MNQREIDYINKVKQNTLQLWNAINNLKSMQRQWNALQYGTNLPDDLILHADVGAVVFDAANALSTVLDNGQAGNLAKLL